jgi:hypothetical protein
MRIERAVGAIVLFFVWQAAAEPARAQGDAPLSAIDWLSQSVTATPGADPAAPARPAEEPATPGSAVPADVSVSALDGPAPDGVGLLTSDQTGLPHDLWGMGLTREIATSIAEERSDLLPALQSLMVKLMLAKAAPPVDADGKGTLLLARIDKLLSLGALTEAAALIEAAGSTNIELFRRSFDVALLTGKEDRACDVMRASPSLAPTFPARIFCLARAGDWNAAALTLRTAQALGYVTDEEDALLSRFLDPELYDEEPPLPPPARPSPLLWRMYEAIGETLPTGTLPLAFAHAELRDQAGWKAQIEAAERLARAGVLDPASLLDIYTSRLPAASGGVWDRVEAFQRFDTAVVAGDPGAVARTLPDAWQMMTEAELESAFADLFGMRLRRLPLTQEAAALAMRIGLLSADYMAIADAPAIMAPDTDPMDAFLLGIARGNLQGVTPPDSLARAIAPAFLRSGAFPEAESLLAENRVGETILLAIDRIGRGVQGDLRGVTEGLALLRHLELEDIARRTALELMILERRG